MYDNGTYKFPGVSSIRQRNDNWYDTAQVCLNGHTIIDRLIAMPELGKKFCPTCGEPTISACPSCNAPIQGYFHIGSAFYTSKFTPPHNCHECGAKFPWTERTLAAAAGLTDELNLTDEEKQTVKDKLPDVVQDTPSAKASAYTLKRLLAKAEQAGSVAAGIIRELALDFAAKTTAEIIKGP